MAEPSIIFNDVNERQTVFTRRAFLMGGVTGLALGVLTGRLAQLQLIDNKRYRELARGNRFEDRLIIPPRGLIVDRHDVTLASNRPKFSVTVTRDALHDIPGTLDALSGIVPMSDEKRARLERDITASPRYRPVIVADDMSWEQFSAIQVRAPELPGVMADMGEARVYPFGGAFAHVIGYVSKPNEDDLKATDSERNDFTLHPAFRIGKVGLERSLEKPLRGIPGFLAIEVDAHHRPVGRRPEEDVPPTPGDKVVLTLDADVQNRALEVFGAESGAAVMMDCRTGDLLCLASSPSFDANQFVRGMPTAEYNALASYERKPLYNKALTATYPAGSTFKMTVALAALEAGIPPSTTHTCGGSWRLGNHVYHCDASHGTLDMHEGIKKSCDVYFYATAMAVGPDKIAETARKMGYGQKYDIGIPGLQSSGTVPNPAWKREMFKNAKDKSLQVWYPGDTPSYGIGQGALTVNALQQCVMVARYANGRTSLVPRLIKSIGGVEQPAAEHAGALPFPAEHIDVIRNAMAAVANEVGGTGYNASKLDLGDIKMAGKTGTAQSHTYTGSRATLGGAWNKRDHAWFVAFAPYDAPRYALAVLVEHGGWGASAAAPRAREIMRVALMKDPEIIERVRQFEAQSKTQGRPADANATPDAPPPEEVRSDLPPPPTTLDATGAPILAPAPTQ